MARDEVRVVTSSTVVGTGSSYAFNEGDVLVLEAGTAPDALVRCSRVHAGPAPVEATRFDRAEFDRRTRPEPPPKPAPRPISAEDVRAMFAWDSAQFDTARRLGFPKPAGVRLSSGAELFDRAAVANWAEAIASLDLDGL